MNFPPSVARLSIPICGFALSARGFTFLLISGFFLCAAITIDAAKAGGLGDALRWLQSQPYGLAVFTVTALGLFSFGPYSVTEAAWRRLDQ